MNRGACRATVHGVTKSQTRLSNFHFKASEEEELQMTSSSPFLLFHHFQPLQAVSSLTHKLSCKYSYLAHFLSLAEFSHILSTRLLCPEGINSALCRWGCKKQWACMEQVLPLLAHHSSGP